MDITMESGYTETDADFTYSESSIANLKVEDKMADSVVFSADGSANSDGEEYPMYVAFKDGYFYMNVEGTKMKLTVEEMVAMGMIEEGEDVFASMMETDSSALVALPAAALNGVTSNVDENRSSTFVIMLNDAQFKEYYKDYSENLIEQITYGSEVKSCTFTDVKVTVTIDKEGFAVYYSIDVKFDISYDAYGDGEYVNSKVVSSNALTLNNPGKTVEVTLPEDVDSYYGMYELYLAELRAIDWKEYGAGLLDWNVDSWEDFLTKNNVPEESFEEVMAVVEWEDFKAIVLEDLNV